MGCNSSVPVVDRKDFLTEAKLKNSLNNSDINFDTPKKHTRDISIPGTADQKSQDPPENSTEIKDKDSTKQVSLTQSGKLAEADKLDFKYDIEEIDRLLIKLIDPLVCRSNHRPR